MLTAPSIHELTCALRSGKRGCLWMQLQSEIGYSHLTVAAGWHRTCRSSLCLTLLWYIYRGRGMCIFCSETDLTGSNPPQNLGEGPRSVSGWTPVRVAIPGGD